MHVYVSGYRRRRDKYPDGAAHQVSQSEPGKSTTITFSSP